MQQGILAEFQTPEELVDALVALRSGGYRRLDAFTPYPLRAAEEALRLGRSWLSWPVLLFGILGAAGAYLIQWWCNAYDYPLNVGGRPPHSAPAFIPITFEMAVLSAAVGGLVLFFVTSGLPELYSPVFDVPGFERASIDRFWVFVDERDPAFDPAAVERELRALGALQVAYAEARR
jgi:hypothetical protein